MSNLLTNKYLLIGLGIIAVIGLLFIISNAAQTTTPPQVNIPAFESVHPKSAKLPPPVKDTPVSGQIIVKFNSQYTTAQINEHLQQYNAHISKTIEGINQTVVTVPSGQEEIIMQKLQNDGYAQTVQRDYTTHAFFTPNDPGLNLQYGIKNNGQAILGKTGNPHSDINVEPAWDVTQGNGVKVAILDTGINLNHPDLASKVILQKSFISNTVEDGSGHGTHVAGIIAADTNNAAGVAGTCPGCKLLIGKVLDDKGSGTTSNATAGITWAADNGAKVINMSLGTTDPSTASLYAQAVNYALSKGAVVVAAAGNDGTSQLNWPAAASGVISVGATTNKDQKASFSNYGSYVQIAAPGDNILSTGPDHTFDMIPNGYDFSSPYMYLSGTSMATPYVSGVAALIASTSFGTSPQAIANRLYSTADKITGTGSYWIHGRVDAALAVGTAPTSTTAPISTNITPTLYCVGGNGTPPCATIPPSGVTTVPPEISGNPSIAIASPAVSGANPSDIPTNESPSPEEVTSPAPGGSNPGSTPCPNIASIFYNLNTSQQSVSTMANNKKHVKWRRISIEKGNRNGNGNGNQNGNQNGNNGNSFIGRFFQFLLQLLQLFLQIISGCALPPASGAPSPSGTPSQVPPVSGIPSISQTVPSIANPTPTKKPTSPTATPKPGQPTPTTPVTSSTCTNPAHVLPMNPSDPQDGITLDKYYITNDTWNASGFNITQTMYICNYNNWYVTAGNMSEAGGVKTYPNVHEDFNNVPISSFKTVSSTFASTSPPQSDIYDAAYDIWINDQAIEVMIWNNSWNKNERLTPGGSKQATVSFGGRSYDVYKDNGYIAFVATTPFDSGTIDLLQIFKYITTQGWIASNATLSQIDYGIELISTNNQNATFKVTNFSITTN